MKIERVNSEIQKELSAIIANTFKDPRLEGIIISITNVQTTGDLKYAKVIVSVMNGDRKEVIKVLQGGANFMRNELFKRLRVRAVPELTFKLDESLDYAVKINKILKEIMPEGGYPEEDAETEGNSQE